jgi:cytochrome c-type biogenesis protein CcmH
MRRGFSLLAAALGGMLCLAAASDPAERLHDPVREAHARALFRQVRCVQCQSESIDDSEAPLAHDLRQIVREQVAAGRSDTEIKHYLVDRYGEFVLLKPSFDVANTALWLIPLVAALGGAAGFTVYVRRRAAAEEEAELSPEEEAEVHNLLARHAFASTAPQENTQDDLSVS